MQLNNIIPLIDKLARREQSPEEMEHILLFLQQARRQDAEAAMERYYAAMEGADVHADTGDLAYRLEQLISNKPTPVHRIHFLKTTWFKYAAAIIILLTGIATYIFITTSKSQTEVALIQPPLLPKEDILPGSEKAILTLSDGQQVQLNNAASETINDGSLSIKNANGQLVYSSGGGAERLNTMSTPKGGQYKLTLSDGTKVWLNAASSITYPISFTGKKREVSITGEAYFEVSKNKEKPFIVKTASDEITVLGTSFNVNSYAGEIPKTSLLEGSIKIGDNILAPGQAYSNGTIAATDIDQDLAWKNGIFNFNNQDFAASMRQLERWYDIKVVYDGKIPTGKFSGEISRNLNLSDAIELLNGVVARFKLEGRELHVLK